MSETDHLYEQVLITGASSGLGLEFARQLAPRVGALFLVARRKDRLEEIRQELLNGQSHLRAEIFPCDLGDPAEREKMLSRLNDDGIRPDCLINNAGLGDYGQFKKAEWEKTDLMMQVNMVGLTHLTHRLLPGIIEQKGAILNLSSLASTLPIPDFAVYAATKAYVTSFSEALRLELRESQVNVLAVCPGPVKTGFGEVAQRDHDNELPISESFYVPAEKVVCDSIKALRKDRPKIFPGFKVAAASKFIGFLPFCLVRLMMSTRPRRSD